MFISVLLATCCFGIVHNMAVGPPLPSESPVPPKSPVPSESPVPPKSPVPSESPFPSKSPVPSESPVSSESPISSESLFSSESPVPSESLTPLEVSKNLEHVKYHLHRYGSLTEKRLGTNFDKIRSLEVRLSQISKVSNETFKQLVNLEEMTFSYSKIRKVSKDVFSNCCSKLKYLKINHGYGFDEQDIGGIGTLPLEHLEIINVDIPKLKSGAFRGTKLRTLVLIRNNLKEIEEGAFDGLDKLEFLHISYNKIKEIPKKALGNLKSLKSLELGSNDIHFFGTEQLPQMPNLSDINFISENITRLNFLHADTVAPKLKDVFLIGFYPNHIPLLRGPTTVHFWLKY